MRKTYCILGGGGCFGVQTSLYLLDHANPRKVIGIGRSPLRGSPFSLGVEKRAGYVYHPYHITYEIDLLLKLLDEEKPEIIINFAAQGEGAASWENSWRFFETNAVGLSRLCEQLMKRSWLERFVHIGTSEVYGSVTQPAREDSPLSPTSPYAASKLAFDMYLQSVHKFLGFPMNILRPSNAYCPGQLLHRVIPKAIWSGLRGERLPLHGGGHAEKSYIHARDLAHAIHLVTESAPVGAIYNVGPEGPIPIREVVARIARELDLRLEQLCEITGDRLGEDSKYWLDSSAIRDAVGWKPTTSLDQGLAEMVNWGRTYWQEIKDLPTAYVIRA